MVAPPSAGGAGTGGSLALTGQQAYLPTELQASERPSFKNNVGSF